MSVFFLRKRWLKIAIYLCSFVITAFSLSYALVLREVEASGTERIFYFLVSENPHLQVSTIEIQLENGAGYLLKDGNKEYTALSVYLRSSESEKALQSASKRFSDLKIIPVESGKLYFSSRLDKKQAPKILGGLNTLFGCMQVIDYEIKRLEEGATQQSVKRVLQEIEGTIVFLGQDNEFFSSVCKSTATALNKSVSDIVYLKDLRYLLCELCSAYKNISEEFSL
jgi:hypothetical protein